MDGIEPCPFCGSIDITYARTTPHNYTRITCWTCGATGPAEGDKGEAKYKWNKRYKKRKGINVPL